MKHESIQLAREEVNAIIKLILYIKFECEDPGTLIYSSSPLINSALEKMLNMYGYKDDWDKVFSKFLEADKNFVIKRVEYLEKHENSPLDEGIKQQILSNHAYPYKW
ncbi:hypothetical protein GPY51_23235 [Photorhabdus laumondii subsp. laumondii]|uniref:Photorhabdus luminescens subsp. laumondii TTO1 complete genome segment 2/17 n=3 Tax=Photorhabdus TaxID=29487 RepID=Q7N9I1_PHOLL|nr:MULTISPECIES: hypothetical protein [Photorhabdus]AWK40325.1 hypothetical protein A4R40_01715 [Photorhabdus laumondii subsp. laumondii]AXG45666.1 hypothetical protein PluTT01m_01790 [Photorhabdus laumondii subsp. laumondii]KTL62698.1 hypothetical protein AA106_19525 [Photorhabdus laumondii subsp. laumondii]MBS9423934.1 hypothetical protein [Photorhabdus caribbeanensis]MCC8386175.1 hypothetical protein [Photorhabdus laumondii]